MVLLWIFLILMYFISNLTIVCAVIWPDKDGKGEDVGASWIFFGIFFALPTLVFGSIILFIGTMIGNMRDEIAFDKANKLRKKKLKKEREEVAI